MEEGLFTVRGLEKGTRKYVVLTRCKQGNQTKKAVKIECERGYFWVPKGIYKRGGINNEGDSLILPYWFKIEIKENEK